VWDVSVAARLPGTRDHFVTGPITAMYRLSRLSDGAIHRRYEGVVSVDIALIATRIERGIVAELERSMPVAVACTQAFLDRPCAI